MSRCLYYVVAAVSVASSACQEPARPWAQPDGGGPSVLRTESPPTSLREAVRDDGATSATSAAAPSPGSSASSLPAREDPDVPKLPVRVGGPWVRCYGGFHPSGDPVKDVTRLSLLCGPENGMRRHTKSASRGGPFATLTGAVSEGGPPLHDTFDARRGECYRVFAVAEPSVADLDVVVRSKRGTPIAADHGEDAWPIVQPDRPFCALEDDTLTWEISAKRGAGRASAEVWVLRAGRERDKLAPVDALDVPH